MPKLYPFQQEGVRFLLSHRRAILADEMGLGKTGQVCMALSTLGHDPVLIFAPASLCLNWQIELTKWTGMPSIFERASDSFRFPERGEVIIRTYNSLPYTYVPEDHFLPRFWPTMYPVPENITVVYDEAHYLKSSHSERSLSARVIASHAKRVWALTGTPLLNRPPELWALGQALGYAAKDIFGKWEDFVRMFGGIPKSKYGGFFWKGASPVARERLTRVMLRRRRDEVMPELPRKTYHDIPLPIGKEIDVPKAKIWDDERIIKECKPPVGALSEIRAKLAKAKAQAALEIALQFIHAGEPLVIFSAHRIVESIHRSLLVKSIATGLITGTTDMMARQEQVKAFQAGGLPVMLGTIGAMGTGLTLTYACHALFIDLDWVPANNSQAEDRICRIGQTRPVVIHRLISESPIDRRVWGVLARKSKLVASLEAS